MLSEPVSPISESSCLIHSASLLPSVNAVYSASSVESATRVRFFEAQDTAAPPREKMYPPIDFRSFRSPSQSQRIPAIPFRFVCTRGWGLWFP